MKVLSKKYCIILIILSTLTYAINNVGRSSFAANITVIGNEFGSTKQTLGIITSCMFFAYGGCQILHSVLSKYYKAKIVVPLALIVSAICNFLISIVNINSMKYVWLINGIAQSFVWCNILNVEAKYLQKKYIGRAIVWVGSAQCIGLSFLYLISSIFAEVNWRVTFYIIFFLMIISAVVFYLFLNKFEKVEKIDEIEINSKMNTSLVTVKPSTSLFIVAAVISITAIPTAFFRDALSVWMPSILKDSFGINDSYAIFITTPLLLLSIVGIILSKAIVKRIKSYFITMNILAVTVLISVIVSLFLIDKDAIWLFIICMAINVCLINGNCSVITSQIPFHLKEQINVGGISSLFDAFCYLGSMLSSVIVGSIADNGGWNEVLFAYLILAIIIIVLSILLFIICKNTKLGKNKILI